MLEALSDEHYMRLALREAEEAYRAEEVPVGALIVCRGIIIARAYNLCERLHDFTAHAEMQAFTAASEYLGGKQLNECTLYVTLEPCVMCMGAAFNTRISRVVFGAYDPKRGYLRTASQIEDQSGFIHPKTEITGGVLAEECSALLKAFFEERRS
jgi:tRNA(adenine34) deaminase